tara:strand:- start:1820 stop:2236 length:417 start_codon:yes stop_codon:yes gene_type:complete
MYEYEKVGRIFVDSGQIAVGDPCYTLGHPEGIGDGELKLARDKDGGWLHDENGTVIEVDETIGKLNAYSKFCQATLTGDKPYGIIDGGVAFNTSTTHGDGSYQVTIVKDSFGTQRGIYICLDGSDPDIEVKEDDDSYL